HGSICGGRSMNSPGASQDNSDFALKSMLRELADGWRQSAEDENRRASHLPEPEAVPLKRTAEILSHCADALDGAMSAHEQRNKTAALKEWAGGAKTAPTASSSRPNPSRWNKRSRSWIIDALLVLLFGGVVAVCAIWIFKIITHWKVKGLG